MDKLRISHLSKEFVQVPVRVEREGQPFDPTGDSVEFAFVAPGTEPAPADWHVGQWETDMTGPIATYLAECLVGPGGGVALAEDTYAIFVKVTDAPEVPVKAAGLLEVF